MAATDMHTLFSNSFPQIQDLICDRVSFYEFTRMKRSGEEEGNGLRKFKENRGWIMEKTGSWANEMFSRDLCKVVIRERKEAKCRIEFVEHRCCASRTLKPIF